ncbi:GGDEF domain-containing protein [Aquamicrobium sp. LC103]|uniref:GGDEF domain-containing protein n=1 Tax=Aquamicrobium sp. LC103 TaxID=1120658 RepID=UPI00063E9E03|nr:GGDEF domain-containing protein [Aquamicrobium sp. LC103]TKT76810.1 GGDEF domain-containing protein [Aquamicrobium sp. LC103]
MGFDLTSLLLAAAVSGACLSGLMIVAWLTAAGERFMITWALGALVVVGHVIAYWAHSASPSLWAGMTAIVLLPAGLMVLLASTYQLCKIPMPTRALATILAAYIFMALPLAAAGYDGVALILQNALATAFLTGSAVLFWRSRRESHGHMASLAFLYVLCGVSFGLCGVVIFYEGQWSIGYPPDNWAERLNVVVAVACTTAGGALMLTINQAMLARRHRVESLTDPLTGLLNRRALFSLYDDRLFGEHAAAVMFDIDHFKRVNDTYGHAAGDEVLRRFASALSRYSRPGDDPVRLGGEEFTLIMTRVTREQARAVVGGIAAAFAAESVITPNGEIRCTVSAGIGFGGHPATTLDEMLTRADRALYTAKKAGRNCIEADDLQLAS